MNNLTKPNATSLAKPDALPDAIVDRLFQRFEGMYMARWLDSISGTDMALVKRAWAEGLAGVTPEAMRAALNALTGDFPPSLPTFRELCRQFRLRGNAAAVLLQLPRTPVPSDTFKRLHEIVGQGRPSEEPSRDH